MREGQGIEVKKNKLSVELELSAGTHILWVRGVLMRSEKRISSSGHYNLLIGMENPVSTLSYAKCNELNVIGFGLYNILVGQIQ